MSPVAVNGVDKQGIDVNGIQVKQSLNPANETVSKGVYAATTLSTVDTDLAVGNIKNGVTIFGFVGTYTGPATLSQDILGTANTALAAANAGGSVYQLSVSGSSDGATLATLAQTYNALSRAVGVGAIAATDSGSANNFKLRLYMDGVQMAESGFLVTPIVPVVIMATKVMSGLKTCYIAAHNYNGGAVFLNIHGTDATGAGQIAALVAVGSIKLV